VSQTLGLGQWDSHRCTVPASQPLGGWNPGTLNRRTLNRGTLAALAGAALALSLALANAAFAQTEPKAEGRAKIAFVGDSTADGLWGGFTSLVPREACLKSNMELGRFAKNSTGLTRPEKFNWVEELRRLGESFKPQLFVVSLGLNDRQSVVEHGKVTLENSPDYPARYKERVTAALKSAAAANASLLWVGLPAMREAAADRDAREKNKLFAEAIAELADPRIEYVEPWKLNPTGEDKFSSFGPDGKGKMIQIRASDGEHFTSAGDMLVAAYLLPKIVATLVKAGVKLSEACAS
jgi:uncharacterized protein